MATEALKSTQVTNADASPATLNSGAVAGGYLRELIGVVEVTNGTTTGSTYRMVRVNSSDRISRILLSCDDIGTTLTADCGIYQTAANGGAVVDADCFASAVSLKDGALTNSDITHESGVWDIANEHYRVWQVLGLSSDPKREYDIVLTSTANADAGGTISLKVQLQRNP